jgi:hypothetical protein
VGVVLVLPPCSAGLTTDSCRQRGLQRSGLGCCIKRAEQVLK